MSISINHHCQGFTQHDFAKLTGIQPMKTSGNIKRNYKTFLHRQSRAGFTLIELLVSIAIVGILSVIMFSNFSKEKDRNGLKNVVNQMQADLLGNQTKAQAGVTSGGAGGLPPNGFGLSLDTASPSTAIIFADGIPSGSTVGDNWRNGATDADLLTRTLTDVTILRLTTGADLSTSTYSRVDIVYQTPNGKAFIKDTAGSASLGSVGVVLKSTKLGVCYALVITGNVGTVSKRKFVSCT